jgi:site-specific DNA-adenine methylase
VRKLGQPLKYAGGKGHAAEQLLNCRPEHFDEFRDVCCGGSPFIFHVDILPLTMPRWINDLDSPLVNFFLQFRDSDSFIPDFLQLKRQIIGNADRTLQAFNRAKTDYETNAVSYLLLRRFALNQIVRKSRPNVASVSFEYLADPAMLRPFTRSKMEAWKKVLEGVKITCGDFSSVLNSPVNGVCWFFIDPPYWSNNFKPQGAEIYEHSFDLNSHTRLRDELAELNPATHPFLMTICDSELSHSLYGVDGRFFVFDRRVLYGMQSNVPKKVIRELVVTNYPI